MNPFLKNGFGDVAQLDTGHKALCPVSRPENPGIMLDDGAGIHCAVYAINPGIIGARVVKIKGLRAYIQAYIAGSRLCHLTTSDRY